MCGIVPSPPHALMLGGSDLGVDHGKPGPTCPAGEEIKAGRLLMGHEGACSTPRPSPAIHFQWTKIGTASWSKLAGKVELTIFMQKRINQTFDKI